MVLRGRLPPFDECEYFGSNCPNEGAVIGGVPSPPNLSLCSMTQARENKHHIFIDRYDMRQNIYTKTIKDHKEGGGVTRVSFLQYLYHLSNLIYSVQSDGIARGGGNLFVAVIHVAWQKNIVWSRTFVHIFFSAHIGWKDGAAK